MNRKDWSSTTHWVICIGHFEEKFIKHGKNVNSSGSFIQYQQSITTHNPTSHFNLCLDNFISWKLFYQIHEVDTIGNLKKAPKLTYSSVQPGNKKQNVTLALAIFQEMTPAKMRNYFPNRLGKKF